MKKIFVGHSPLFLRLFAALVFSSLLIFSVQIAQAGEPHGQTPAVAQTSEILANSAVERFLRYAAVNTQSLPDVASIPSTPGQWDLARLLEKELREIGLSDVKLDNQCYLYATLPGTGTENPERIPTIGFISHLDTSNAVTETTFNPIVHRNYQGGDITLTGSPPATIRVEKNHELKKAVGDDLITSDGTTVLGGDDKAGIAEIVTAMEFFIKHPEIPHGTVKIAFTPDEEVDMGPKGFDIKGFNASFAYTVDGGPEGEINDETFTAASANVVFMGKSSHPGHAKGEMINCLYALAHFVSKLPVDRRAENSEGRQGFIHPFDLKGNEEKSSVQLLIRDFEPSGIEEKKDLLKTVVETTKAAFPTVKIELSFEDSYKNMKVALASFPFIVEYAEEAMTRAGIKPLKTPIRGGTDGADFSFMGLPCANFFTGVHGEHSREEWVAKKAMGKATETIINLVQICHSRSKRK